MSTLPCPVPEGLPKLSYLLFFYFYGARHSHQLSDLILQNDPSATHLCPMSALVPYKPFISQKISLLSWKNLWIRARVLQSPGTTSPTFSDILDTQASFINPDDFVEPQVVWTFLALWDPCEQRANSAQEGLEKSCSQENTCPLFVAEPWQWVKQHSELPLISICCLVFLFCFAI